VRVSVLAILALAGAWSVPALAASCDAEINSGVAQLGKHNTAMEKAVNQAKSLSEEAQRQQPAAMAPLRKAHAQLRIACREGQQAVKVGDKILTLAKRPSCGREADKVAAFDKSVAEMKTSVGALCTEVGNLDKQMKAGR
jgi:hypothetical protein